MEKHSLEDRAYLEKLFKLLGNFCPVCGLDLKQPAWPGGEPEWGLICPCCGIEFGVKDVLPEFLDIYRNWRKEWIADGMKWKSRKVPIDFPNDELTLEKLRSFPDDSPTNWDPKKQLENIPPEFK